MSKDEKSSNYNPLKKSYPDSEKINSVSEGAECLYVRLIAQSDDAHHYYAEAQWVLAKLFTGRMVAGLAVKEVQKRLDELAQVDLIRFYEVDGKKYLEVVDCFKTFRPDRKKKIVYPQPLTPTVSQAERERNASDTESTRERIASVVIDPDHTHTHTQTQTKPDTLLPAADAARDREGFEKFWQAYPRRVSKIAAEKAWKIATKKATAADIITAAEEFATSDVGQSGEFCPHPASWLNAGRWTDDRAAWTRPDGATGSKRNAEPLDLSGVQALEEERNGNGGAAR